MSQRPPPFRAFHRLDPRRATLRLLISLAVGTAVGFTVPRPFGAVLQVVAGWDAGAFTLLTLAWVIIARSDETETGHRAAAADPGRTAVWGIVLASSTASLFAAVVALR